MPYRPPPRKSGGGSTVLVVLGVIGGLCLLAVLCCGGGVFYLGYRGKQLQAERYEQYDQEIAEFEARNAEMLGGRPAGGNSAPVVNRAPSNPAPQNVDEMLVALRSPDVAEQEQALNWLTWNKDEADGAPHRDVVAQELNALLKNHALRERALDALADWATETNVTSLQEIADTNFGPHVKAKIALARLKDERAIPQIAALLGEFAQTDTARQALEAIGPAAESEVIKRFNDKDHGVREAARGLIRSYRTQHEAIVAQCALDVASAESEQRKGAAEWLESAEIDEAQRVEVSKALEKMMVEESHWNREAAAKALGKWATKENTPGLIRLLDHSDGNVGEMALKVLVDLKDPAAAAPIAAGLEDFFKRGKAADALRDMGPSAESAVIPYLRNSDAWVRIETCKILKDIGGPESIDALILTLKSDSDRGVCDEARRALVVLASVEPELRTWSDKSGKFNVEARLQEVKDSKAWLKKKDGSVVAAPIADLSDADQLYVRNEQKRRRFLNGE